MAAAAVGGAIVIPAHDEESVILATLAGVAPLAAAGTQIIVAANGCTDRTAELARSVPGVQVLEIAEASKVAALNAADSQDHQWPCLYLDADIGIEPEAVLAVFARLDEGTVQAARPASRYRTAGASLLVRSYYRARARIPALSARLWGAGAYALTEQAHARLERFPSVIADDLYVDQLFDDSEIAIVECVAVDVEAPRTARALLRVLRRVYLGKAQLVVRGDASAVSGTAGLLRVLTVVRGPVELVDAVVYCSFAVLARLVALRASEKWLRDETTRVPEAVRHVATSQGRYRPGAQA